MSATRQYLAGVPRGALDQNAVEASRAFGSSALEFSGRTP